MLTMSLLRWTAFFTWLKLSAVVFESLPVCVCVCVFQVTKVCVASSGVCSGCWLEVSVERSGQLWNHYHLYAPGRIWTRCHLSTNRSFVIKLTRVCMCVCICARVFINLWHVGRGNGMSLSMCVHMNIRRVMDDSRALPIFCVCIFV